MPWSWWGIIESTARVRYPSIADTEGTQRLSFVIRPKCQSVAWVHPNIHFGPLQGDEYEFIFSIRINLDILDATVMLRDLGDANHWPNRKSKSEKATINCWSQTCCLHGCQ